MPSSKLRHSVFRHIVRPTTEKLTGRSFLRVERELAAFQWLSPEAVSRFQRDRLAVIARHAFTTVPYYRALSEKAGLGPEEVTVESFHRIPVTRRQDLKLQFPDGILSETEPHPKRFHRTSGSSGEPVRLYRDPTLDDYGLATAAVFDVWAGLVPGDRRVGLHLPDLRHTGWRRRLRAAVRGHFLVSPDTVLARDGKAIAGILNRVRPEAIVAYPSFLQLAVKAMAHEGCRLSFSPKAVIYFAEVMDPDTQAMVRDFFAAPVYSRYGAAEFTPLIAQSCPNLVAGGGPPEENLHLNARCLYVEIVDDAGRPVPPETEGRIVITDLWNRVMPMIRYEIGDIGCLAGEPCSCGRGLPLLRRLVARTSDFVILPSGKRIPLLPILREFRPQAELMWEYQIVQPDPAHLLVDVVPVGAYGEAEERALRNHLLAFLGEPIDIRVQPVACIPRGPSGKRPVLKQGSPGSQFHAPSEPPGEA